MMKRLRLNRKLVLETVRNEPDGGGGFEQHWMQRGTLWADVSARTGRERAGEALSLSSVPYRVVVRAAPIGDPARPKAGQRLRDDDRIFAIEAVAEHDPEGRYLICFAREEVVS